MKNYWAVRELILEMIMRAPIPQGFIITTEACIEYTKNQKQFPEGLWEQVQDNLKKLEENSKKIFGNIENPLLVSVRSGAAISMPGMMDTILNLGLNDHTIQGIIKKSNNERFAFDSYRRFIQMFGNVVMGIKGELFEGILDGTKQKEKVENDSEISISGLKEVVKKYKELVYKEMGENFPEDPQKQLRMAIEAVFSSWDNKRAVTYRRIHKIPDDWVLQLTFRRWFSEIWELIQVRESVSHVTLQLERKKIMENTY